uniref:Uncharacterized protein n=1 Tax=Parascaris univalens TaxID=6257 RepID=A0A915C2X1_PARUN
AQSAACSLRASFRSVRRPFHPDRRRPLVSVPFANDFFLHTYLCTFELLLGERILCRIILVYLAAFLLKSSKKITKISALNVIYTAHFTENYFLKAYFYFFS